MALAAVLAGTAERDPVVDKAVVTDLGGLAYDDAHAMVDNKALADLCAGVDLYARAVPPHLGYHSGKEHELMLIAPMGASVIAYGLHARIQQQHLDGVFRRRIAGKIGIYGFKQLL